MERVFRHALCMILLTTLAGADVGAERESSKSAESAVEVTSCEITHEGLNVLSNESTTVPETAEYSAALVCASEAYRGRGNLAAAHRLATRASEIGEKIGSDNTTASALRELGKVLHEQRDAEQLSEVWDRLAELEKSNGSSSFRLSLVGALLDLASAAYSRHDFAVAAPLVARVEEYHHGDGYGTDALDPFWLPDMYLAMGEPEKAASIHEARLTRAREEGEALLLSDRLAHYAEYLEAVGDETAAAAAMKEAAQIRDTRLRELDGAID